MGFQIEDGSGTSQIASVAKAGAKGRLDVSARTDHRIYYSSRDDGLAFQWTAYQDWGADVNALWIKNDDDDRSLIIERVEVMAPAAVVWEIWVGSGSTTGGTVVTGVNLNRGSGKTAQATARHTNTNVDAGSGLTLLGTFLGPASEVHVFDPHDSLILTTNQEIAVNIVTDVSTTAVNILGYFDTEK